MTEQRRLLELAILGLQSERTRIEQEILEITRKLGRPAGQPLAGGPGGGNKLRAGQPPKRMTEAQKKKISQAMKARWAARRRAKSA